MEDVKFAVLQSIGGEGKTYRQWIVRLETKTQFGCNIQLNY